MPEPSKVSISRRANPCASASRPLCTLSAPQQPCPAGISTSQPSAARIRTVAELTSGKNALCTHPVSIPTTARRVPRARTSRGGFGTLVSRGASDSRVARVGPSRSSRPVRATRRCSPEA
jgi:hypothetical protein